MKSRTESAHSQNNETTDQNAIQQRAYELYLKRDQQPGHDLEDWLQAEQEVAGNQRRQSSASRR